ncbi:hypothetical protein HJG60_010042 [Phyllostomus discolor]|uniref:Uncharacterized protein n=1 Tax=Phyllostomus discolor TaxID=89673 RepID=A0A834EJW0_9CHIR|nr:hypothetical protein HJG60_010042 [Phyllostomus discolor]
MHVQEALASSRVQSWQHPSTPSVRVPRRPLLPQMEVTSRCCLCEQGNTQKEKAFESVRWKCLRKEREKPEIIFYFFRTIIATHRNLQCLFICFCLFQTIPPLLPTPDLLKRYQVNAKGHFRNSSELPKRKPVPPARFLQLIQEDTGRRDAAALALELHSHSSLMALKCIIMQM